jgi:hypothetical protein
VRFDRFEVESFQHGLGLLDEGLDNSHQLLIGRLHDNVSGRSLLRCVVGNPPGLITGTAGPAPLEPVL